MSFEKNAELINTICQVQVRSVDNAVTVPVLSEIYHTPSKIRYSINSRRTDHGNLHTRTLRMTYPGLSEADFENFDSLLRGVYQVFVKLQNQKVYELSNTRYPMSCSSSFDLRTGHQLVFTNRSPFTINYVGDDTPDNSGKGPVFDEFFDYTFDFNLA